MESTPRSWWPTLCRACHRWQAHAVCRVCFNPQTHVPARCHRCALILYPGGRPHDDGVCALCQDDPPTFDHAIAALDYAAPWQHLIAALKFRQDPAMARTLSALLVDQVLRRWGLARPGGRQAPRPLRSSAPRLIVPVPLSAERLRERGYNQAALLAQHTARALRLPLIPTLLVRSRHTARLMDLDADARQQHIRGAFSVPKTQLTALKGQHVAVVDDVLTTGATLNEIARTLWTAGAREVSVWVVARTPTPGRQRPEAEDEDGRNTELAWQDTQPMELNHTQGQA